MTPLAYSHCEAEEFTVPCNLTYCVDIKASNYLEHVRTFPIVLQYLKQPCLIYSVKHLFQINEAHAQGHIACLRSFKQVVYWNKKIFKMMLFPEPSLCARPPPTYLSLGLQGFIKTRGIKFCKRSHHTDRPGVACQLSVPFFEYGCQLHGVSFRWYGCGHHLVE